MDETRYTQDQEMIREAVRVSGEPQKPESVLEAEQPLPVAEN